MRFWLLVCLTFGLPAVAEEEAPTGNSQEAMEAAAAELPEGRFLALTDKLFPVDHSHFDSDIALPRLAEWERRMADEHGFDYAFVNAPLWQGSSKTPDDYLDNEMSLYLQWRLGEGEEVSSKLFFWGLWQQTLSDDPNEKFSRAQGLLTSTLSSGTDPGKSFVSPSALWWEQSFDTPGVTYRVGQLYATNLWGNNRYTADDREGFMNAVLSNNVGLPWSDRPRGLGALVRKATPLGYVAIGFQDAKGDQEKIDGKSFVDGRYLYTAEVAITRDVGTNTEGRYKLAVGYMDSSDEFDDQGKETQSSGWGVVASAHRDFVGDYALFAQLRHSFNGRVAREIKSSANAGIVWTNPWGWPNDELGLGLIYARPGDKSLRDEYGFEVYWRLQMTHRLDITPDLQVLRRARGNAGITAIPGFRLRYIL